MSQHQPHRYAAMFDAHALGLLPVPRYNVAPSTLLMVCRENPVHEREMAALTWGFVPRWARDSKGPRPINARAETLFSKHLFRDSARLRRCLVPADGFYEWRKEGKVKQPYFVRLKGSEPFALAAIWDGRTEEDGSVTETVAIVVTDPNSLIAPLHDRMPVIVAPADYGLWLDSTIHDPGRLQPVLRPFAPELMETIRVSREVNRVASEGPGLVEPLD